MRSASSRRLVEQLEWARTRKSPPGADPPLAATKLTQCRSGRSVDAQRGGRVNSRLKRTTEENLADSQSSLDVVVIGGRPGGYAAAIPAAQVRLLTAMIQK